MIDHPLIPAVVMNQLRRLLVIIGDAGVQQPALGGRKLRMDEILHFRVAELEADLPVRHFFADQAALLEIIRQFYDL